MTNISTHAAITTSGEISELFKILGHRVRLEILLEIGEGEACVCHLESRLEQRQAYISQHLMVLRDAGLLTTRQEGRYVYYSLGDPQTLALIHKACQLLGLPSDPERAPSPRECPCPKCRQIEEVTR